MTNLILKKIIFFFLVPPKKFEFSLLTSEEAAAAAASLRDGSFSLSPETPESSSPLLRCSVESVYPKPVLTFSELSTGNGSPVPPPSLAGGHRPPFPQVFPSVEVITSVNDSTGLYSSSFTYRLPAESIKVGTVYECKLELPPPPPPPSSSTSGSGLGSTFTRKKRIKLIYPSSESFCSLSLSC